MKDDISKKMFVEGRGDLIEVTSFNDASTTVVHTEEKGIRVDLSYLEALQLAKRLIETVVSDKEWEKHLLEEQ